MCVLVSHMCDTLICTLSLTHTYVYLCMNKCIYVFLFVCVYIYVYIYVYTYICLYIYMYMKRMYQRKEVHVFHIYIGINLYIFRNTYTYKHIYIYIYIYICTHTRIHTYLHAPFNTHKGGTYILTHNSAFVPKCGWVMAYIPEYAYLNMCQCVSSCRFLNADVWMCDSAYHYVCFPNVDVWLRMHLWLFVSAYHRVGFWMRMCACVTVRIITYVSQMWMCDCICMCEYL